MSGRKGAALRDTVLRLTASVCLALVVGRFGFALDRSLVDPALAVIAAVYLLAVLVPDGRSLRERLVSDRWMSLFLGILVLGVAAAGLSAVLGTLDGGGATRLALGMVISQTILISIRILLWWLGSAIISTLPAWAILPVTIAAVIGGGAALLMLPAASNGGISAVDAFFTSTSATCVTGLSVMDISSRLTQFGQVVVLLLIQVGGLGLMSFVAFFALFLGHSVGLGESVSLSRAMDSEFLSDLRRMLASIMAWTFTIEASGALVLYTTWRSLMPGQTALHTAWLSVFHSISAFCNAGLSLFPDNLEGFSTSPATCFTFGILIVMGGLGFGVLTSMAAWSIQRLRGRRDQRPPIQARLALTVTAALLAVAMLAFLALEWDRNLGSLSIVDRIANAFLGAATPRTAGFDTIPMQVIHPFLQWMFVALMFIGASPGGTGGGVKTTTLGLFAAGFLSLVRQRPEPELWHRRIPGYDLQRAAALTLAAALVCVASSLFLTVSESGSISSGARGIFEYVFESVSAFGTVGLSLGVTPELTTAGRWAIILTMFLGRVGPAALAAVTARPRVLRYSFPEGRISIG
jgi:trk system potassium uptake protein TrkH